MVVCPVSLAELHRLTRDRVEEYCSGSEGKVLHVWELNNVSPVRAGRSYLKHTSASVSVRFSMCDLVELPTAAVDTVSTDVPEPHAPAPPSVMTQLLDSTLPQNHYVPEMSLSGFRFK